MIKKQGWWDRGKGQREGDRGESWLCKEEENESGFGSISGKRGVLQITLTFLDKKICL